MDDNFVWVGNKAFMNYITAVVIQFTSLNQDEVIIKARGKFISRAVDVSEVITKRFLRECVYLKDIFIGSQRFEGPNGEIRVSFRDYPG